MQQQFQKLVSLGLFLLVLLSGCSQETAYPSRPITFICPWSPGGGTDRVTRQIASQLERELGIPVNVINATGGGGVTGHTRGALARPDGYNMTMVTAEINMLHWRGLTNITYEDYRLLMKVNRDNAALFVRADAPWQTLEELEESIRENPGEMEASGTAFGGIWHVSLAGWLLEAGLSADAVTWISINGSAPSLQELTAGGVDVVACSFPEARSLYEAGEIRSLGVMADERLEDHPEVPTFIEQGYDWSNETWRGVAVPAEMADEQYTILLDALDSVLNSDEYQNFLESSGFGGGFESGNEFLASLEIENENYGEIFNSDAFQSVVSQRYGPMLFPMILMGLTFLVIVGIVASSGFRKAENADDITSPDLRRLAWIIGSIILFLVTVEFLGFIIATTLIMILLMWQFRVTWTTALPVILISVPLIYHIFAVYLRVPLPWGLLGW